MKWKSLRRKRLHIYCMYCLLVFVYLFWWTDQIFAISWDPTYLLTKQLLRKNSKNRKEERTMYDVSKISIFYLFHSLTSKFVVWTVYCNAFRPFFVQSNVIPLFHIWCFKFWTWFYWSGSVLKSVLKKGIMIIDQTEKGQNT